MFKSFIPLSVGASRNKQRLSNSFSDHRSYTFNFSLSRPLNQPFYLHVFNQYTSSICYFRILFRFRALFCPVIMVSEMVHTLSKLFNSVRIGIGDDRMFFIRFQFIWAGFQYPKFVSRHRPSALVNHHA